MNKEMPPAGFPNKKSRVLLPRGRRADALPAECPQRRRKGGGRGLRAPRLSLSPGSGGGAHWLAPRGGWGWGAKPLERGDHASFQVRATENRRDTAASAGPQGPGVRLGGHVHPKGGRGEAVSSPSFTVAPDWLAICQLGSAPLDRATPSPSAKSARDERHSVARALRCSWTRSSPPRRCRRRRLCLLPPPSRLSVVTRGSGGPGAAGLERAPCGRRVFVNS